MISLKIQQEDNTIEFWLEVINIMYTFFFLIWDLLFIIIKDIFLRQYSPVRHNTFWKLPLGHIVNKINGNFYYPVQCFFIICSLVKGLLEYLCIFTLDVALRSVKNIYTSISFIALHHFKIS